MWGPRARSLSPAETSKTESRQPRWAPRPPLVRTPRPWAIKKSERYAPPNQEPRISRRHCRRGGSPWEKVGTPRAGFVEHDIAISGNNPSHRFALSLALFLCVPLRAPGTVSATSQSPAMLRHMGVAAPLLWSWRAREKCLNHGLKDE
jgi:hypothetical protein